MKHLIFNKTILAGLFCLISLMGWSQITTFDYTGAMQTYTVPAGVTSIQIEAWGAQGGGSEDCDGSFPEDGGLGGYASGDLAVVPGSVLNVFVGGKPTIIPGSGTVGGYNGGGASGQWAGAGGGASDIRIGGTGLGDRILIAGGGGGGNTGCPNHGTGGAGGGLSGEVGINLSGGYDPGGGGTPFAGGAGGGDGSDGALGIGGTGGYHVAGGGGGLYGGGGAYAAGGGGGSSFLGDLDAAITTLGVREGNGQIVITVLCTGLTLEDVDTDICEGDAIALNASSETGGIVMWDGGIENDVEFIPGDAGSYTYTATSTSGSDCNLVVEIIVHGLPAIVANADPETVCFGQELTLSGSGGAFYEWSPGAIENGVPFVPDFGIMTYTVEGEDWYGCFNTAEVTVEVIDAPVVTANATDDKICLGESIILTGSGAVTYEWDMGVEDGVSFTPATTGTFIYNVDGFVDGEGCFGEASIEITVNELPTIESYTTIEELLGDDGSINITVSGGTPAYDFDWDNDGAGEFGDPEDLTGIAGGTYIVIVKDANGCEDSETILVDSKLGISHDKLGELIIYPNPSADFISILQQGQFNYVITSINGEIVITGNGFNSEKVDLSKMASGVYLIDVMVDEVKRTIKLVKE